MESISAIPFDYTEESPNRWQDLLAAIKATEASVITTPVYWGAHEQSRGIRDFSKSSRLKLEKFLQAAHAVGLAVDMMVGFPAGREVLPTWTAEIAARTLVPSGALNGRDGFGVVSVPALHDKTFTEGLLGFLDETFYLLSLYRSPEGPVCRILIDLGMYNFDLCAMEAPGYLEALRSRYPAIAALNSCYTTAFKDFGAVTTRQGIRVMNDRRSWLAAFDYKWCRRQSLLALKDQIVSLESARAVADCIAMAPVSSSAHAPSISASERPFQIAFEPALIETFGRDAGAFTPAGFINELSANAFRLWEYFKEASRLDEIPLDFLPLWEAGTLPEAPLTVVVSGKYMSHAAFESIAARVGGGGAFFFPLGLPQYDETMTALPWPPPRQRSFTRVCDRQLSVFQQGQGKVWFGSPAFALSDSLWHEISETVGGLHA